MNLFKGVLGFYFKVDIDVVKVMFYCVGLYEQMYKRVDEFSGGQQQRVGIVCVFLQKLDLILVDELIVSFDFVFLEMIMYYLYMICKEEGIVCLCNLYQVDIVKRYVICIIGIYKGFKVFDGIFEELMEDMIWFIYNQINFKVKEIV